MIATDVVTLVGHVAWPVTVLILLFLLRGEVRSVLSAIRDRVANTAMDVRITHEGLELKTRVEVLEGSLETQQLKTDVLATAVTPEAQSKQLSSDLPSTLLSLAQAYRQVSEPDYARRLQLKNELAQTMGAVVLTSNVDRGVLAQQHDEVLTLALATAIIALPSPGDDKLLLSAGRGVKRLHVRYRIAAAFAQLAQSRNLNPDLLSDTRRLLESYHDSADASLLTRLDRTAALLDRYAKGA